ncbi:uncharacterized protein LOC134820894 [Bolinopsis microptera]|uniref:uncharacterized protein LOC134820894 n=1 Tax=Bolinopsis microptera TaxID=2820187 RepID=UPI0030796183
MAVPTGKQGLRGTFDSWNNDSKKVTTLESNHRQSVSEHLTTFRTTKETQNNTQSALQNMFKQQTATNGNKRTTSGTGNTSSNTSGLNKANEKCFCGKQHSGGRRECSWFC